MEEWKEIVDHTNYMISSFGNVKNLKSGKTLKPSFDSHGYYTVDFRKNGKRSTPK
eukprot:gene2721-3866_t